MHVKRLLSLAALWLLAGCGSPAPQGQREHLADFSIAGTDFYPLADGRALAVTSSGDGATVFLLASDEAAKVTEVPADLGLPDIYPLADGSAYLLFGSAGKFAIYRLEGNALVRVRETKGPMPSSTRTPDRAAFAWVDRIAEKTRKARAEREKLQAQQSEEEEMRDSRW